MLAVVSVGGSIGFPVEPVTVPKRMHMCSKLTQSAVQRNCSGGIADIVVMDVDLFFHHFIHRTMKSWI